MILQWGYTVADRQYPVTFQNAKTLLIKTVPHFQMLIFFVNNKTFTKPAVEFITSGDVFEESPSRYAYIGPVTTNVYEIVNFITNHE